MAQGSARIDSPEVIRRFRSHFVVFEETCREALAQVQWDIQKASDWVGREQLRYWKRQLRKRAEAHHLARLAYQRARHDARQSSHSTSVDAKVAFKKAERLKEEAEEKMRAVKKWMTVLEHSATDLLSPCLSLSAKMEALAPRALARLDRMADSLDAYFSASATETPPSSAPEE